MRVTFIRFIDTIFYLMYLIIKEDLRNYIKKICIDEKDKSKRVHILANGPSLNLFLNKLETNFKEYGNDDFCGINYFSNTDWYTILRPKYYALSDPQFFTEKHHDYKKAEDMLARMNNITEWKMYLFIPYVYLKSMKRISNKNIIIVPLHSREYIGLESLRFYFYKKGLGNGEFGTVIQNAIYALITLHIKEIYLHGADHNYFNGLIVTDNNQLYYQYQHFYDKTKIEMKPVSFGNKYNISLCNYLQHITQIFKGHKILNMYAEEQNCEIINCTPGSFIDAYKRKRI